MNDYGNWVEKGRYTVEDMMKRVKELQAYHIRELNLLYEMEKELCG